MFREIIYIKFFFRSRPEVKIYSDLKPGPVIYFSFQLFDFETIKIVFGNLFIVCVYYFYIFKYLIIRSIKVVVPEPMFEKNWSVSDYFIGYHKAPGIKGIIIFCGVIYIVE